MIHITKENAKTLFLLFDLDGTLVDTDKIHISCYKKVGIEEEDISSKLRRGELHVTPEQKKQKAICVEEICKRDGVEWMPGAEKIISFCFQQNVNFCIVTNTARKPVEAICSKIPLLHKALDQGRLLCREDYTHRKPHPDGYETAIRKFYKGESFIFGFENTFLGWSALQAVDMCNKYNFLVLSGGKEDEADVRAKGGICIESLKIITENA